MKLLKEWAIVCQALDQGRQILIARKGGLMDEDQRFKLAELEFFLMPTYLHQKKEWIKPKYHLEFDRVAQEMPPDRKILVRNFAKVTDVWNVRSTDILKKMDKEHLWTTKILEQRLSWGKEIGLTIVALRVYRLFDAITLPHLKSYDGCVSWIEPKKRINNQFMVPCLSTDEYQEKRMRLASLVREF